MKVNFQIIVSPSVGRSGNMIDKEKWEQSDDQQKLSICKTLRDGANERTISKDDYNIMWHFLLDYIEKQ